MVEKTHAETIFGNAIEVGAIEDRNAFLEEACHGDPALRQEVEKLVQDYFRAGGFLEQPVAQIASPTIAPPMTEKTGAQIGPYKLLEQIGEGGMGLVFMARQQRPIKRNVALKLIKPGMDTRQVIARFEAERQVLAMLDHPAIARVLDAGTTEMGRPYFVMDLVLGVPITDYCDEHQLSTRKRLELFVRVCQGVQHAHQKGVIHRDIKPTNVLVTSHDGVPAPKVIDFGIAKAVSGPLSEKTAVTSFAQLIGTPQYMSPEQSEMNALDVDTRSDIYSLGVLLYELLTGQTPFDRERLRAAGFDNIRRIICEGECPRPSDRLSTLAHEDQSTVSRQRGSDPRRLIQSLRGELDWIVMKALEVDRTRRYATANAFAEDVQRCLAHEPVQAGPPSTLYRFRKFAERNKTVVLATSLVGMALLLGIAGTAWQAAAVVAERRNTDREYQQRIAALEQVARISTYQQLALAHFEWHQGAAGTADQILDQIPQDERDWAWHYLKRLCHSELRRFDVPKFEGQQFVRGRNGPRLVLRNGPSFNAWDVATGDTAATFADIRLAAMDSSGSFLAEVAGSSDLTIRRVETGQVQTRLPVTEDAVRGLALSQVGHVVVVATNSEIAVWDWENRKKLLHLEAAQPQNLTISSNGRFLAATVDGKITIWSVDEGKELYQFSGVAPQTPIVFHPADTHLAFAKENAGPVVVVELANGEVAHRFASQRSAVRAFAFSPDGQQLATGKDDGRLVIWDVSSEQRVRTILGATEAIVAVTFGEEGHLVHTLDNARQVKTWDAQRDQTAFRLPMSTAWNAALSPDGDLLAVTAFDASVSIVDVDTGATVMSESYSKDQPWGVDFSPQGNLVAVGSTAGIIKIWEPTMGVVRGRFPAEGADWPATAIAFSSDGKRIASGGQGRVVCVWNVETGNKILELSGHSMSVTNIAFSPDGKVLVSGAGGMLHQLRGTGPSGDPLPMDKNSDAGDIRIWNAETGELLRSIDNLQGKTEGLAISPDGLTLATTFDDGSVRLYDIATGKVVNSWRCHFVSAWSAAFHPTDDRLFVTADVNGAVKLWDLESAQEILTVGRHPMQVNRIQFSQDGARMLTVSMDDVSVWDGTPLTTQQEEVGE